MTTVAPDEFFLRELLICGNCLGHPMHPMVSCGLRLYRCASRHCGRRVRAELVEHSAWVQFVAALPAMRGIDPSQRGRALADHLVVVRLAVGIVQARLIWSNRSRVGG